MVKAVLEINNLIIKYKTSAKSEKNFAAVKNVSLNINSGERFCLIGESGSGKTSVALAIPKLLPESSIVTGDIFINNFNIYKINSKDLIELRKKNISFIFQDSVGSLIPNLRIDKQLRRVVAYRLNLNNKVEVYEIIKLFLKKVHLHDADRILNSYPIQLSGGMAQRIMIAMALCVKPSLVIADEPTSSLDVLTQRTILEMLMELQKELDYALLFITHDMRIASHFSDKIGVMQNGTLIECNKTKEFFDKPKEEYSKQLIESARMISI